jgi:hypothetical protein
MMKKMGHVIVFDGIFIFFTKKRLVFVERMGEALISPLVYHWFPQ